MSNEEPAYGLRVTGPAERQLNRLPGGTAAAIVEFMLGALLDNPHRVGGELQRELAGMRSARRGAYRIIYEIDESHRLVVVLRIEHRATAYRPR
ncbi:MAG TPA: type II toxin-antitoxin system RelE/ParE family toxin [Ilumatobacteraceae bacterium]